MAKMGSQQRARIRKQVWARCDGRCEYCNAEMTMQSMTLDHWIPRSKGGTNAASNIRGACQPCNLKKADKHPIDEVFNAMEAKFASRTLADPTR